MFAWLKRMFWILLGLVLVAGLIWRLGPLFSFARHTPLETPYARLIAIGVVVGLWVAARLIKRMRAFRASDRLLGAVVAQPQPEPARPSGDAVKLRGRFEEAVAALKQQRRGGHSLYELPWYVIIGAPGSGKTTALLNSGLTFPLEQRVGKGALRGVGGTRNCDWWFTDEAIFLDTAGRYTSQDSDAASDRAGWREFLALLQKYRARRPVNGVILTISAHDLIVQGPAAREAHVEAARARLDELNGELRIQLPVYLMVTKCDLVDGFTEYFDDLTADQRAQVWGVTFPYEQTLTNEAPRAFAAELDALIVRLNERVFTRIEEARDIRRRTRIFAFPQQMAAMRDALTEFVTDVFATSQFDRQTLLRGVYFTSGTQHGTPIDRLLGIIGRSFGASAAVAAPAGHGKAYFVARLLREVMIGESGLAGVNRGLEARKAAVQLGAYAATGLVAASGVAALWIGYSRNRTYLDETRTEIAVLDRTAPPSATTSLERAVPRLDALWAIVESSGRFSGGTIWPLRWGLHQGGSIGNAARDAYYRELDSVLLPRVAAQISARLGRYGADPSLLFRYLRAYLMLGDPDRLDRAELVSLADLEWAQLGSGPASVGGSVSRHFKRLLEANSTLRPLPVNATLVSQARFTLRASRARVSYENLKRAYPDSEGEGPRIDQGVGIGVDRIFRRRSGLPLSAPVPRFYSRPAFQSFSTTGQAALIKQLASDGWVYGDDDAASLATGVKLVSTVTGLYEQDYIKTWNELLNDLQCLPFTNVADINAALQILTSSASPLRGILDVVRDNTTLVESPAAAAPSGAIAQATKSVKDRFDGATKVFRDAAGLPAVAAGSRVTAEFQWVRQLLVGEPGKTPFDAIIDSMRAIQQQLDTLGPEVAAAEPGQILASPSFRGLMQTMRHQAETLPPALRRLVLQVVGSAEGAVAADATRLFEKRYAQEVVPRCNAAIGNRYPFTGADKKDVTLSDFAMVFGYDGLFDRFFTQEMEKQVDVSQTPWAWLPGSVTASRQLLEQFRAAQQVRDMFFGSTTKSLEVKFTLTIANVDPRYKRFVLEIDGSNFEARPGRPSTAAVTWPGAAPGFARASFEGDFWDSGAGFGGPWAWFKMIDRFGPADLRQGVRLTVPDRPGQTQVHLAVEGSSASNNPFSNQVWRQFRCDS